MKLEVDPKLDIAFKKVFGTEGNAPVLIDLLSAVVQPARTITGLEIVPALSEKDTPLDKQVIADVKARDQGNRQFHVEMQSWAPWFFPNRVLYYWAKFHSQQLREGEDYQVLRPTIFVCFANQIIYPEEDSFHLIFRPLEVTKGKLAFGDAVEIHLIELPKFTKTVEQLSSALDRWCYFLRHGAELDLEHLPASLDVPMIRRAMEVLTVFTQDEREREAYEQRLKFQRDQSSLMREVREARAAKEKGIAIGQIQVYQEMLKQPQTPEAELAAMSQEDLAALIAQLRKQVFPNGG